MEMEELEITIPRDGTVQVRTKGMKGSACVAATKELEEAVGSLVARNFTADYFSEDRNTELRQNCVGNGTYRNR